MPLITKRRILTRQPQYPARVNTGALGAPIKHLWALDVKGEAGCIDSVSGVDGVFGSGSGVYGNKWERLPSGDSIIRFSDAGTGGAGNTALYVGNSSGSAAPSGDQFTLICRVFIASSAGYQQYLYSAGAGAVALRATTDGTRLELMKDGSALIAASSTAFALGGYHWIAVSYDGALARFYVDSNPVESGGSAYTFSSASQATLGYSLFAGSQYKLQNGGAIGSFLIADGALPEAAIRAYFKNPHIVFSPTVSLQFVAPSAGGGGLSLTGSLTGQGSTLSGAATNTEVHALSGALVGAGATLSGAATRIYSLTGSLTGQGATISGSATAIEIHAATGALVGAGSTLSATATNTEIHTATGALVGAGSTLSGAAVHAPVGINASGSLTGQGATLSAAATNTEVHTCTGSLYGQGATLSGALTRVFSASGSLVGAGSTLSATAGNAVALFSATGSLVGQGATLTGSATNTETHAVSGSLTGQGASLSATAALANLHTLSGSLVGSGAILVGYASGPTTAFDTPPDAIVTVINKLNRVSVISRRS